MTSGAKPLGAASLVAALLMLAPAAARAAGDPAPVPRPDALQQPVEDGCQRNPVGLLTFSSPEWVYVYSRESFNPDPARARLIEGTASFSDTATGDLPQNHDYYDFNTDVDPDPGYGYLLGGDPATKTGNFGDSPTLHVEWETDTLGRYAWITQGDRLKLWGSWVWDCGHWGQGFAADPNDPLGSAVSDTDYFLPGTNQTGGLRGEGSEFHPMQAVVVRRKTSTLAEAAETQVDVFMSSAGTIAHSEGKCSLAHPPSGPTSYGPEWTACINDPANQRQPVNDRDYSFFIPAPPKPSPEAQLRLRIVDRNPAGRGPKEIVVPHQDGVEVTVPFDGFGNDSERLAYGKTFFLGWDGPVQDIPARVAVDFKKLTIHHSLDDPGPSTSLGVPPGEWNLYSDINGAWTLINDYAPALGAVNSGDVLNLDHTYSLTVPKDGGLRVAIDGRECDLPRIKPCPITSEVAEDNDSPGTAADSYPSLAAALGTHTLKPPGADPNWELTYEVRQLSPAVHVTGPGAGPAPCIDTFAPTSQIVRRGVRAYRHHIRLRGRSRDRDCLGRARPRRVELSVARRTGSGECRFLSKDGHLSAPRRCAKRSYLKARGRGGWHAFRRWPGLPGTYLIASRAVDAVGNLELRSTAANSFRFEVGRDLRILALP
jgi:hypothetical protein